MHTSHSHGQVTAHVPFLDFFARFHSGTGCSSRQTGAARVGGSVAPSADVTWVSPSVESAFTTSISYAPFHRRISPSHTVTGEMPCAERERNRGWCVHTGGPGCTSGGLKTSSTTSRLANPTRASNPTPNSNSCPNVGTSSPPPPSQQAEAVLELQGGGGVQMRRIRLNPPMTPIGGPLALSPQYRINVQAGTALGEATEERWDEVLLQQGEVLVMVSTARHPGLPSPPGQQMQGALFTHEGGDVAAGGVAVKGGGACRGRWRHPCAGAGPPTQHPTR